MKRSVRNGLAIAGMAGGMWLLGHAVANADTGQTAAADNTASQTQTGSGGSSSNDSTNVATAENDNSTAVSTGNIKGGNGGRNTASINTGVVGGGGGGVAPTGGGDTHVSVSTGDVKVTQQANGGSVSGSGNVHVDNSATQSASASNNVTQSSTSTGGKGRDGHESDGQDSVSSDRVVFDGGGQGHGGGNDSTNIAVAANDNSTRVDTGNIRGGSGGVNEANINTGLIVEPVFGVVETFSDNEYDGHKHRGDIDVMVSTGAVWVRQEANGGDVTGSGNVDVNGNVHQSASASNDVTQTSTSADRRKKGGWWSGKGGGNDSTDVAVAANDNSTFVGTGNIRGGYGGGNYLDANTGLIGSAFSGGLPSSLDVSTGDVHAVQEANGGDVTGSGNVNVCTSADQSASAGNGVTQNSSSGGGKARSGNDSTDKAIAHNENGTLVLTGNIRGGSGGRNLAQLTTGAILQPVFLYDGLSSSYEKGGREHHHRSIDVTVSTGDVSATQEANGGDVTGSGNVDVTTSAEQSASASNDVTQNSSTTGDHHGKWWFEGRTGNDSRNIAVARNDNVTFVGTGNIRGGNGGENFLDANTGLIGPAFFGGLPSSLDVTTGDVHAVQEANGGDVTGSGNVSVGDNKQCGCEQAAKPTPPSHKPAAPVVKTVTKTETAVTVLSGTQPTGTLAVTGADTSAPLTAGLLALGAGAALTLAGRRRREGQNG